MDNLICPSILRYSNYLFALLEQQDVHGRSNALPQRTAASKRSKEMLNFQQSPLSTSLVEDGDLAPGAYIQLKLPIR
jgi:hypothetical protein